jgi:hypothetical protein
MPNYNNNSNFNNNNNNNNRRKNRPRRRNNKRRRNNNPMSNQPSYVSLAPQRISSQTVQVRQLTQIAIEVEQGSRFKGAFNMNPYAFIKNSAWAKYLEVWARYRTEGYRVKIYFPVMNEAYNPGSIAAVLFRDGVDQGNPLRAYEELVVEPGSVHRRLSRPIVFNWRPVEPTDRDWYNSDKQGQDYPGFGAFGTLCAAGMFDDLTNRPEADFVLYVDVTINVTFSGLRKPPTSPYDPDGIARAIDDNETVVVSNNRTARPVSRQFMKFF